MTKGILFTIAVVLVILLTTFAGCTQSTSTGTTVTPKPYGEDIKGNYAHIHQEWSDGVPGEGYWIYKVTIPEDNVTCYVMDNYEGGGISCFSGIV